MKEAMQENVMLNKDKTAADDTEAENLELISQDLTQKFQKLEEKESELQDILKALQDIFDTLKKREAELKKREMALQEVYKDFKN